MAQMYEIYKTIKPVRRHSYFFLDNIPFEIMKAGDCVVVPAKDIKLHNVKACRGEIYTMALKWGWRAQTEVDSQGNIKIWRKHEKS